MIRNNVIRKPSRSKIVLKCLLSMTVVAIVLCVCLTVALNSLLKNSIAYNEDVLVETVNNAISAGQDQHSYINLSSEVNNAPKTIGRDVVVYVDGEAFYVGGFGSPLSDVHFSPITIDGETYVYSNDTLLDDTDSIDFLEVEETDEYIVRINLEGTALDQHIDYVDQNIVERIFPIFESYYYEEAEPVAFEYTVIDEDGICTETLKLVLPEDSICFDESRYTEFLGETNVFYDANGNVHTCFIKATPNIYARNIFQNTKSAMFIIYGLILLVCLIIGTIASVVVYYRSKNIYDVFAYRTNITNALAHDLKTPLMAISSYAENYTVSNDSSKKDYYVAKISDNASYMDSIITNALSLSKAESVASSIVKEEFFIKELTEDITNQLSCLITKKQLKIVNNLSDTKVSTDKTIFKKVLLALIENSVKYSSENSEITISNSSDETIRITNKYDGEIHNLDKLKEPFVRGSSERNELGGSGLGLAIADKELYNLGYTLNISVEDKMFVVTIV